MTQPDYQATLTALFVDDDQLVRTGRALLEVNQLGYIIVPVPAGWEDHVQGVIDAAGLADQVSEEVRQAVADMNVVVQTATSAAESAAADREATGADRVQTGQDREATGADREATAADRVATGEDRAAVTQDRERAEQAATATGEDRVVVEAATGEARQARDEAASSATAADSAATRAETAVESTHWDGDRLSVMGELGPSLRGPRGEVGPPGDVSTEQLNTELAKKADLVGGVVPTSQLPGVALTKPWVVADLDGMLGLAAEEGDVAVITHGDWKGSYMLGDGTSGVAESWVRLSTPDAPVQSVNGQTGTVVLTASDVGALSSSILYYSPTAETVPLRRAGGTVDVGVATGGAHAVPKSQLDQALAGKADAGHRHVLGDVTGLQALADRLNAIKATWDWDGEGEFVPPAGARVGDRVINWSTGEGHRIIEEES